MCTRTVRKQELSGEAVVAAQGFARKIYEPPNSSRPSGGCRPVIWTAAIWTHLHIILSGCIPPVAAQF